MRKTTVLLAVGLGFLMIQGIQTQAGIVITEVKTTGWASALSGIGYESWDAEEFGDFVANASAHSNQGPGGSHMASSTASVSFDELNSMIQISSTSSASSATSQSYTSSNSFIQFYVSLDSSYAVSLTGSQSASEALPSPLMIDDMNRHYTIGDSGIIGPGSFYFEGRCSSHANSEGFSTFQSYSATLSLDPILTGDFDEDGDVDGNDFLVWQRNLAIGNLSDWQSDYGMVAALTANTSAVPEPSSLLLLLLAAAYSVSRERPSHG